MCIYIYTIYSRAPTAVMLISSIDWMPQSLPSSFFLPPQLFLSNPCPVTMHSPGLPLTSVHDSSRVRSRIDSLIMQEQPSTPFPCNYSPNQIINRNARKHCVCNQEKLGPKQKSSNVLCVYNTIHVLYIHRCTVQYLQIIALCIIYSLIDKLLTIEDTKCVQYTRLSIKNELRSQAETPPPIHMYVCTIHTCT